MEEKMTTDLRKNLSLANELSLRNEHAMIQPEHLLLAMLEDKRILKALVDAKVNTAKLKDILSEKLQHLPKNTGLPGEVNLSRESVRIFNVAQQLSHKYNQPFNSRMLLIALVEGRSELVQLMIQCGLDQASLVRQGSNEQVNENQEALNEYTHDLTESARAGRIDPVIGRDHEIRRLIQVLQRRTKNNPVLVGAPGVGKTAIAEGLAQRIANEEVPEGMRGKRLLALDIAGMVAGAKYRGEFEERLKKVLNAIKEQADQIILFIDELHMLVGAGRTEGGMDASNMLKPALARGMLHCVGATTIDEYRQYIEKDAALERRFQLVKVDEPSEKDTIAILRGLKEKYEIHHGVGISDDAIIASTRYGHRFIPGRQSPDIEIDIIDEAASQIRMEMDSKPESLDILDRQLTQLRMECQAIKKDKDASSKKRLVDIEKQIKSAEEEYSSLERVWLLEKDHLQVVQQIKEKLDQARVDLEIATRENNLALMSEIQYGRIPGLEQQLTEKEKQVKSSLTLLRNNVTEHEVAQIVSKWTGIPVTKMLSSDKARLLSLGKVLHERLIGQEKAIKAVVHAIQRNRAGIGDIHRPVGSFLFLGPTGVGKTELCKTLADELFDDDHALVRIDMSEYMEKHAVARLIGAPPGYVGYESGGYLTEQVRRRPYTVVLLDEVEKAHPDVFNTLLQVLDDGRLTDGQGRTVDFRHTIMVMTSNLGSGSSDKAMMMDALRAFFKPEFLNRIDDIVIFDSLDKESLHRIVSIQCQHLIKRLAEQDVLLIIPEQVIAWLSDKGYDPQYGARPLKRAIQTYLTNPLAVYMLEHDSLSGRRIKSVLGSDAVLFKEED